MAKHDDGSTEHAQVVCPDCKAVLMECVDCERTDEKRIGFRRCVDFLVGVDRCIGASEVRA